MKLQIHYTSDYTSTANPPQLCRNKKKKKGPAPASKLENVA